MIISDEQATDELFQIIKNNQAEIETYLGYSLDIRWQGIEKNTPPDISKVWIRVLKKTLDEDRDYASTADPTSNYYHVTGILSIEIFGPTADLLSWRKIIYCGNLLKSKYKRYSNLGIRFSKSVLKEAEPEVKWYKVNLLVYYDYDEKRV